MLFVSRLSLDEQANILVSSLAEHRAVLPRKRAAELCVELAGREEKAAAKWLRERLAEIGIAIKHTHALRLIGLLTGRAGWHNPPGDAGGGFHLMSMGLAAPEERHGHDVHELLGALCDALARWAKGIQQPAVVTLRRSSRAVASELANECIEVPAVAPLLEPIVSTVPLQLLSYAMALRRGCDVDQPRNLAKTVTVE